MYFIKRMFFYVVIILLFISIYKDLTVGAPLLKDNKTSHNQQISFGNYGNDLSAVQILVQPGDTVLSITEEINHQLKDIDIDIEQMMTDFKRMNPEIDPHSLQPNTAYYFPLY